MKDHILEFIIYLTTIMAIYSAEKIVLPQAASHVNMHTVYGNEIKF